MSKDRLTMTEIRGTPRACGRAYGEAFETPILGFCKMELQPDARKIRYAKKCWPHVLKHAPASAEMIRGIAEGARLSLDHAILLTLHEEIFHAPHCTAFIATGDATREGKTIVAQNWDWNPQLYPWAGLLRLRTKGAPRAALYHYPGLWACAGVNDRGLSLMWTGGGYLPKVAPIVGVPTYVLIAEIMRRATVEEAVAYLTALPIAGCFLFFLGDASGAAAVVEGAAGKMSVDRSGSLMVRANHYACREIVACSRQHKNLKTKNATTAYRSSRMDKLTSNHRGRITPKVARAILTDRGGSWPWLHQFPRADQADLGGITVDSLFAVCEERVLWTCRGGRIPGPWQSLSA
jgi:isopenicillin-N N-acyltransferase-like protein